MPIDEANVELWKSQLKTFELVRVPIDVVPEGDEGIDSGLMVFCPHCHEWWTVKLRWVRAAYGRHKTHNCPWCSKTAKVPKLPRR